MASAVGLKRRIIDAEIEAIIDGLEISPQKKQFLRSRWLDQLSWMDKRASDARARYYVLRISAITCGVMVPALAGIGYSSSASATTSSLIVVLGLIVAATTALEEFLRYGDRWRHYRQVAELLRSEGWRYLQLSTPYRRYETHEKAYPAFADHVEDLLRRDVHEYVTELIRPRSEEETRQEASEQSPLGR